MRSREGLRLDPQMRRIYPLVCLPELCLYCAGQRLDAFEPTHPQLRIHAVLRRAQSCANEGQSFNLRSRNTPSLFEELRGGEERE